MPIAQTQIGNNDSTVLILGLITAIGIIAGPLIGLIFRILRQILKELYDFRAWQTSYIKETTDNQTARLEACIHATPGHPENPKKWDGSDRRRQAGSQPGSQPGGTEVK